MPALDEPLTLEYLATKMDRLEGKVRNLEAKVNRQDREIEKLGGGGGGGDRRSRDREPAPVVSRGPQGAPGQTYYTQVVPSDQSYSAGPPAKRMRVEPMQAMPMHHAPMAQVMAQPMPVAQPMMMAPAMAQPMPQSNPPPEPGPGEAQIRIQVEGTYVKDLIGKKGTNVQQLQRDSNCDINFEKMPRDMWHLPTVVTLTGREDGLIKACQSIAANIADLSQSREHKLILCVPDSHCGFVCGKKGANHKRIMTKFDGLYIQIASQSSFVHQWAGKLIPCDVHGPPDSVSGAISEVVKDLAKVFIMNRGGGGGRRGGGGRGGGRSFGGGGGQQFGGGQQYIAAAPSYGGGGGGGGGFSYAQRPQGRY